MNDIPEPTCPAGDPRRPLECEEALLPTFRKIARRQPEREWTGQEREFWLLRVDAAEAGWSLEEIDNAVRRLVLRRFRSF